MNTPSLPQAADIMAQLTPHVEVRPTLGGGMALNTYGVIHATTTLQQEMSYLLGLEARRDDVRLLAESAIVAYLRCLKVGAS